MRSNSSNRLRAPFRMFKIMLVVCVLFSGGRAMAQDMPEARKVTEVNVDWEHSEGMIFLPPFCKQISIMLT